MVGGGVVVEQTVVTTVHTLVGCWGLKGRGGVTLFSFVDSERIEEVG